MAQLKKENEELSMIVNESVELAEMYKAELLQIKDKKESDDETSRFRDFSDFYIFKNNCSISSMQNSV